MKTVKRSIKIQLNKHVNSMKHDKKHGNEVINDHVLKLIKKHGKQHGNEFIEDLGIKLIKQHNEKPGDELIDDRILKLIKKHGKKHHKTRGVELIEDLGLKFIKKHRKKHDDDLGLKPIKKLDKKHGDELVDDLGLKPVKKLYKKHGDELLDDFGLKMIKKHGRKHIDKFVDELGLKPIKKLDKKHGDELVDELGLKPIKKLDKKHGNELLDDLGLKMIKKHSKKHDDKLVDDDLVLKLIKKHADKFVDELGLKPIKKLDKKHGYEHIDDLGLKMIKKHDQKNGDELIDNHLLKLIKKHGKKYKKLMSTHNNLFNVSNDYESQYDNNHHEEQYECNHNFFNDYHQYHVLIDNFDSSSSSSSSSLGEEYEYEFEGEGGAFKYEPYGEFGEEELFEEEKSRSAASESEEYLPQLYEDEYIYEDDYEEPIKVRIKCNVKEMAGETRLKMMWDLLADAEKRVLKSIMRDEEGGDAKEGAEQELELNTQQPQRQLTLLKNIKRCALILEDILIAAFNSMEPKLYMAEIICELDVRFRQEILKRKLTARRERAHRNNLADVNIILHDIIASIPGMRSSEHVLHRMRYWGKKYERDISYAEKHHGVTFWKYWNESDRVQKAQCKPQAIKNYEAQKQIEYTFGTKFACDLKRELKPLNVNKIPITTEQKHQILERLSIDLHLRAIHIMNVVIHNLREPVDEGDFPDIPYFDLLLQQITDNVTPDMYTSGSDTASDYENYPNAETYRLVNRQKRRCRGIRRTEKFRPPQLSYPMVLHRIIEKLIDDINKLHHKRLPYKREKCIMEKLRPMEPYKDNSLEVFEYNEPGFYNDLIRKNESKLARSVWIERKHLAPANIRTIYKKKRIDYINMDKLPDYSDTSGTDGTFCRESRQSSNHVIDYIDKSRMKQKNPPLEEIYHSKRSKEKNKSMLGHYLNRRT